MIMKYIFLFRTQLLNNVYMFVLDLWPLFTESSFQFLASGPCRLQQRTVDYHIHHEIMGPFSSDTKTFIIYHSAPLRAFTTMGTIYQFAQGCVTNVHQTGHSRDDIGLCSALSGTTLCFGYPSETLQATVTTSDKLGTRKNTLSSAYISAFNVRPATHQIFN